MDAEGVAKLAVNYGLGIVLSVGMACFLGWLLKYVLAQNEKREAGYIDFMKTAVAANTKAITDQGERSTKTIISLEEAHRRQREEHEEHKILLEKIKEENELRREAQIEIVGTLKSIQTALADLNKKAIYYQGRRNT